LLKIQAISIITGTAARFEAPAMLMMKGKKLGQLNRQPKHKKLDFGHVAKIINNNN